MNTKSVLFVGVKPVRHVRVKINDIDYVKSTIAGLSVLILKNGTQIKVIDRKREIEDYILSELEGIF